MRRRKYEFLVFTIACIIAFISVAIRETYLFPTDSTIAEWSDFVVTKKYRLSIALFAFFGYMVSPIGYFALFKMIECSKKTLFSYFGMLLSILGTIIVLPTLGVMMYVSPLAVTMDGGSDMIASALFESAFLLNLAGGIFYSVGVTLFGIAMVRIRYFNRLIVAVFITHGWLLSFGFGSHTMILLGWLFLIITGMYLFKMNSREAD